MRENGKYGQSGVYREYDTCLCRIFGKPDIWGFKQKFDLIFGTRPRTLAGYPINSNPWYLYQLDDNSELGLYV